MNDSESPARLRLERDLYRGLLELGAAGDPRPLLEEALRRAVLALGARQGYLALYGGASLGSEPPFWLAHDCSADDVAELRSRLSRGIVREALENGRTISTAAAIEDPRFAHLESVSLRGIRAVLCAPIGSARLGVLYLQGRAQPGPFEEPDRALVETLAKHVAPWAERLLERVAADDPTAPWRAQLPALQTLAGRSRALADVFRQVALVAPLDVTVLLGGASGVGKTALARAIHQSGPRALGPFVELNCAALPEQLIESELFGAKAGAHSSADRDRPGKVAAAEGGTLFLDEIGELPAASQAKLLQLLQSRTYYALGGATVTQANLRVIAASNIDLEQAVGERRFREDLYYRLAVLRIDVPSLAERIEDVVPLAQALLKEALRRHGLASIDLAVSTQAAIEGSEWPGNVRQLSNAIEAGAIRATAERAAQVEARHLFPASASTTGPDTLQDATRAFQQRLVERVLAEEEWNVTAAARRLDLSRSRLNEMIRAFGLKRP